MDNSNLTVKNNEQASRFEINLDGETAVIDYTEQNGVLTMTHTGVPPRFEGKGIGSRLVKGALEIVKTEGKKIKPLCPFVAKYIERHPEYNSLVA